MRILIKFMTALSFCMIIAVIAAGFAFYQAGLITLLVFVLDTIAFLIVATFLYYIIKVGEKNGT